MFLIKYKKCKGLLALSAGATGFEPAVSALTGPHVEPLHHAPERQVSYHMGNQKSRLFNDGSLRGGERFEGISYN